MITNTPQTLSTASFAHSTLDYAWLRATGIRQLERLAGEQWTDFNTHDPGITILEQFCYALTDLSYRIDYDLPDLLTGDDGDSYGTLFSPATILTTNPVTLTDLRKVLLDVEGVKNGWITIQEEVTPPLAYDPADQSLYLQARAQRQPLALRGVYQVWIEADSGVDEVTLRKAVSQRLHACRNLGEAFEPPTVLRPQPLVVAATLEVAAVTDPDQLLATLYHRLANWLAPRPRFYTLAELLAQGEPLDAIMAGPLLEHGFLRDADLASLGSQRVGLRTSDLIQILMDVADVRAVKEITLWDGNHQEAWYLPLNAASAPVLDIEQSLNTAALKLARNGLPVPTNPARVKSLFAALQQAERATPQPAAQRDRPLSPGRNRHIGRYHSLQQQLPALYGLGELGLPATAPAARQVQAKQLQGYLLFFDQLLANAFAQVAHVKDLFAFAAAAPQTYFSQPLDDPRLGRADLWVKEQPAARADQLQQLTEAPAAAVARKQRFLNHLLARFAEAFTDFQVDPAAPNALLHAKAAFLQAYPDLSANRGRAANLTWPAAGMNSFDRAGVEKRISHKLGLDDPQPLALAALTADAAGGFYLVEHILLRPQAADRAATTLTTGEVGWQDGVLLAFPDEPRLRPDPYSQQLSFVFPAWLDRFNEAARPGIAQLLREECPAHLSVHLHWANQADMARFEAAYDAWRRALAQPTPDGRALPERVARDVLIEWLGLGAPYPLRDLPLHYDDMVPHGLTATVQIHYAQPGVTYALCDEEGNPFAGTGVPVAPDASPTTATVKLTTPPIARDVIYTILAVRDRQAGPLESYLQQTVAIKAGINRALGVAFSAGGQALTAASPLIDYNASVTVQISGSQAGISYQVVAADGKTALSDPIAGGGAQIDLSTYPLAEDTTLQINAYRTVDSDTAAMLTATLALQVRPNPQVTVAAVAPIVDYRGTTTLRLVNAQDSATYQIYQRQLIAADYVTATTVAALQVEGEHGETVYIQPPVANTDWTSPAPFVPAGTFTQQTDGSLTVTVADLTEDTLLLVRATKSANDSSLQLAQAVVLLVRPNPEPHVSVVPTTLSRRGEGMVTVNDTQAGVAYQLLIDDQPVGTPGYDYRDRAIETARVEVDFVVEAPDDAKAYQTLRLPTEEITETTTFTVQATKVRTGLGARLNGQVTIAVAPPSSTPPAATEPTTRAEASTVVDLLVSAETGSLLAAVADADTSLEIGPEISPEDAVVDYGQATRIRIKASRAREWYQLWLADQPLADPVKGTGRDRLLATPPLQTDARLALHITRPDDPTAAERVIEVLVLVRPDPTLAVSAQAETGVANAATAITVAVSQVGVQYQLWAGGQPVGAPVDGNGTTIRLATGPLTDTTTFTIRATRLAQPDLFVDLAQQVTVPGVDRSR